MSEARVILDTAAFLDSEKAKRLVQGSKEELRSIVSRFLESCYMDLGKAPRLMDGDDLGLILRELLPRRYGVGDDLAGKTEAALSAYLAYLEGEQVVTHSFELRRALDAESPTFREAVQSGSAHQDGIAVTSKGKTVQHKVDKVGRNDPCPCGSGKKFKKCCWDLGS